MIVKKDCFHVIDHIKHYLPAQNPLKDFVHHNTLHAFQHENFHKALHKASKIFGYQVYLTLQQYREAFKNEKISESALESCLITAKGEEARDQWKEKLLYTFYDETLSQKIGSVRRLWKEHYKANPDKKVHPVLFRTLGSFLDQGIAVEKFPYRHLPFLEAIKSIEKHSRVSFFKSSRARDLLLDDIDLLPELLKIIVGEDTWIEHYLFDQQFAHPGWSGMVSVLEDHPQLLLDQRLISLHDFICFELLLEIDALDQKFGEIWKPLDLAIPADFNPGLFIDPVHEELFEVYKIWQEAYEWSYYDQVLRGLQVVPVHSNEIERSFQAVFCIDDRECSFRRQLERVDPTCETFATAGYFNVAFYFQPEESKFYTKACPAPVKPGHLIKEKQSGKRHQKEIHFSKTTQGLLGGLLSASTLGIWSAVQLGMSILFPKPTAVMVSSDKHMDKNGSLDIVYTGDHENGLQAGFTLDEMADKVENLLKGIGLVQDFAPIVYLIGHGASSTNNTHYAGYDCGACSGRAGSVNARVAAYMANDPQVRDRLNQRGISIPENTQFLGGLHDTTQDEIQFFDEAILKDTNKALHNRNNLRFRKSLVKNAVERSRRFLFVNSNKPDEEIHKKVKQRSFSLFEPRPEWNHATNALCIIGNRKSNRNLFLDRRSFLNSYDYRIDPDGSILLNILNAVAPVCGGINLEYYFSKVDNYRLGAGSKLPHNVMGLIGVANGMDGDLRTGLPMQMINIHEALRLLVIIEHIPEKVQEVLLRNSATYQWFQNAWIHLVVIHPESKELFVYWNERFLPYQTLTDQIAVAENIDEIILSTSESLSVYQIK